MTSRMISVCPASSLCRQSHLFEPGRQRHIPVNGLFPNHLPGLDHRCPEVASRGRRHVAGHLSRFLNLANTINGPKNDAPDPNRLKNPRRSPRKRRRKLRPVQCQVLRCLLRGRPDVYIRPMLIMLVGEGHALILPKRPSLGKIKCRNS